MLEYLSQWDRYYNTLRNLLMFFCYLPLLLLLFRILLKQLASNAIISILIKQILQLGTLQNL